MSFLFGLLIGGAVVYFAKPQVDAVIGLFRKK